MHTEWLAVMTGLGYNHTQTNKSLQIKQFCERICKVWKLERFSCFVVIVKEQKARSYFVVEHCDITGCKQSAVRNQA